MIYFEAEFLSSGEPLKPNMLGGPKIQQWDRRGRGTPIPKGRRWEEETG